MTIKQFIEHAIEGGYSSLMGGDKMCSNEVILLDPIAWQAVGKVSDWKESIERVSTNCKYDGCYSEDQTAEEFEKDSPEDMAELRKESPYEDDSNEYRLYKTAPEWKIKMCRMIDALAEGKTIEQYLETL